MNMKGMLWLMTLTMTAVSDRLNLGLSQAQSCHPQGTTQTYGDGQAF
jgi:hypothetical protein